MICQIVDIAEGYDTIFRKFGKRDEYPVPEYLCIKVAQLLKL
jgi:hypothetical protein